MGVYVRKTGTGSGNKIWLGAGGTARERAEQCNPMRSEAEQREHPAAVFGELCELLDEYGPLWFTAEIRTRAFVALRDLQHGVLGEACPIR